jgi:hypothetical protein
MSLQSEETTEQYDYKYRNFCTIPDRFFVRSEEISSGAFHKKKAGAEPAFLFSLVELSGNQLQK